MHTDSKHSYDIARLNHSKIDFFKARENIGRLLLDLV